MTEWTWVIFHVGVLTQGEMGGLEALGWQYGTNQKVSTLRRNHDNTKAVAIVPVDVLPSIRQEAIVEVVGSTEAVRAIMESDEWQWEDSE